MAKKLINGRLVECGRRTVPASQIRVGMLVRTPSHVGNKRMSDEAPGLPSAMLVKRWNYRTGESLLVDPSDPKVAIDFNIEDLPTQFEVISG